MPKCILRSMKRPTVKHFRRLFLCCLMALATLAAAQSVPKKLAVVNGEAITEADIARVADGRVRQLAASRDQSQSDASFEHDKLAIRWDVLNYLVERKLIRAEAARQMISEEQLIENEVESAIEMPTREMAEAFFQANKVRMPLIDRVSHAEALSQIRAYLIEQMDHSLRSAYIDKLWKQYDVQTFMEPLRTEIATAGFPSYGAVAAPVTIVEFSDFECPDCAAVAEALETVLKLNGDKVRVVYRQFPLAHLHAHAQKAAEGSLCAHEQQRFLEFRNSLFEDQKSLAITDLKRRAAKLKLNQAVFDACLDSGKHAKSIDRDLDEGYGAGVKDTPTIFVNGRMFSGLRTTNEIQKIVDEESHAENF
jgi:predicted DsbA family dithiol-disulfide isomerase